MGGWALPLSTWHTGAIAVILPKAEPRVILETIARERVTYFYAVPTVYASLLAMPDFDRFDLSSLRLLGGGTRRHDRGAGAHHHDAVPLQRDGHPLHGSHGRRADQRCTRTTSRGGRRRSGGHIST